mmetsp:Transcript_2179/g.7984  ORF Transcript_2179/g.7984 Transcript_2179/m.7984 type:complete len:103 (-) Transcript_2179:32-340(-)
MDGHVCCVSYTYHINECTMKKKNSTIKWMSENSIFQIALFSRFDRQAKSPFNSTHISHEFQTSNKDIRHLQKKSLHSSVHTSIFFFQRGGVSLRLRRTLLCE